MIEIMLVIMAFLVCLSILISITKALEEYRTKHAIHKIFEQKMKKHLERMNDQEFELFFERMNRLGKNECEK